MKRQIKDVAIIIPAYNPDKKFVDFVRQLREAGYEYVIAIDDGSKEESKSFLEEAEDVYGCQIIKHSINLGQGRAYKSGFNYYLGCDDYKETIGVIQCDCDGQHCVEDVTACADMLREHPDDFVIGTREFSDKSIPLRSRFGNKCTNFVFWFFVGMDLKDVMSGLKGLPRAFVPKLMEASGERFEYVANTILEVKKQGLNVVQFPIHTIYIDGNRSSHFKPVIDSIRIYGLILKYLFSSISTFFIEIFTFSFFVWLLKDSMPQLYIFASVYLAKIIPAVYNFLVNKHFVFQSKGALWATGAKFTALCLAHGFVSAFIINHMVHGLGWNETICKIITDTLLFFFTFQIQNRWVFRKNGK